MSDAHVIDLAALRNRLETLAADLQSVAESGAKAAEPVELDQSRVGRLSRMDDIRSQAMSAEGERRRHREIMRIRAAIKRIDDGEFGYCQTCGKAIAAKRLEIDPAAQLCITCASAAEQRGA